MVKKKKLSFEDRLHQLAVAFGIEKPQINPRMVTEVEVDWTKVDTPFVYALVTDTLLELGKEFKQYGKPNVLIDRKVEVALNNFRLYSEEFAILFARQLSFFGIEIKNPTIVYYYLD